MEFRWQLLRKAQTGLAHAPETVVTSAWGFPPARDLINSEGVILNQIQNDDRPNQVTAPTRILTSAKTQRDLIDVLTYSSVAIKFRHTVFI